MQRPTGVTILAVLFFLGAAIWACVGLAFIVGAGAIAGALSQSSGLSAATIAGLGTVFAVVFFVLGGLYALLGWGMLELKEWARIICLVLTGLSALGAVAAILTGHPIGAIIRLAIVGVVIWYLTQAHVVAAFANRSARAAA
jgi:hypothetical protein